MNAIEIRNLTKQYQGYLAVDSISLHIKEGTLFALLGINGAGKTTIIKMLAGLTMPTSGGAIVLGDSIINKPYTVKQKISLSPQETAIAPNLTVQENLACICGLYGFNKEKTNKRVNTIIKEFQLQSIQSKRAKTLSGGYQRRLSIAMALISEPKILFLDEPTLGLDVLARHELWSIIEDIKKKTTIILTTHYLEEAEALSDQIGIMVQGKLVTVSTAVSLIQQTGTTKFGDAFIKICGGDKG